MIPYYEQDGITIYHGDCRDGLLGRFDLLLTDPPYGIGEARANNPSRGKMAIAKDYGISNWDDKTVDAISMQSLVGRACSAIVFGGNYYDFPPSKCWLVWDKVNHGNDFADCELAWTNLDMAVRKFEYMWNGMLRTKIRSVDEHRYHPTQKPVALMEWCISLAEKKVKVDTVLDPFMGSGTTLVAAKRLGKTAVGIDREEKYCEIAAKRLSQRELFGVEQ